MVMAKQKPKPTRKRKPRPTCDGLTFDSTEELHVYHWCVEAQRHGVLRCFSHQPEAWQLCGSVVEPVPQIGKNGKPIAHKTKVLLRPATYSADFYLEFRSPFWATRCGFRNVTEFIDVKPAFHQADSRAAKFSVLRKWVYQRFQILVLPIVPIELFARTWLPAAAMLTPTGRVRGGKSVQGMRTVQEFLR